MAVLRSCYLALRRTLRAPTLARATGVVLLQESGRGLNARDVGEVLDVPVLAQVHVREPVAHAVDAGVLATRMPETLARSATLLLSRLGLLPERGRAVA